VYALLPPVMRGSPGLSLFWLRENAIRLLRKLATVEPPLMEMVGPAKSPSALPPPSNVLL